MKLVTLDLYTPCVHYWLFCRKHFGVVVWQLNSSPIVHRP